MKQYILSIGLLAFTALSCKPDRYEPTPEKEYMSADEIKIQTLAGGELGTTFNNTASAFQDPSAAVVKAGMENEFKYGEYFFERTFNRNTQPFNGLGPLYVRSSCIDCHPGYGYGKRVEKYRAREYGNGYLLVIFNKNTGAYVSNVAGMPQTLSSAPFKPSLDEDQIQLEWLPYKDQHGNTFPDGEKYSLIYPEMNIPESAFYVPFDEANMSYADLAFRLESTIGVYGTGLLDAIDDDDLLAQYQAEEKVGISLNPAIYANGAWTSLYSNSRQGDGTRHAKKFTYALSRGPVMDGPGANAIWNITNVTRSDRRYHYLDLNGTLYAKTAAKDPEVQASFYDYFPADKFEELTGVQYTGNVEKDIYNYLTSTNLPVEMKDNDYADFMIWHRGLAVPAARNLDDPQVQRGHKVFREIGCAYCHRPSWTTRDDKAYDPNLFFVNGERIADGKKKVLPSYPHQTIWPYTDMIQHRLFMKNDIRTGWCRTTPLWGRGLSALCSGHEDRLHDRRARNVIEAIMWHGVDEQSDAYDATEKFYNLSKEDRDAVVAFINAI